MIERLRAVCRGHHGVVTKLVHEAEDILHKESLNSEHRSRLSVIRQQLDGKLNLLNDMDKYILKHCEVEATGTYIEASENVTAKIIKCNRRHSRQRLLYLQ